MAVVGRIALCAALGALVLTLLACSAPPRLTRGLTPPDPPPVPRPKPAYVSGGDSFVTTAGSTLAPAQSTTQPNGESAVAPPAEIRFHSVVSGDTVFSVARTYGIPLRTLIDNNNLTPPFVLHLGQRLVVPAPRVHLVASGDTVYGISRHYRVDMSDLMRLNRIGPPFTVRLGQTLVLPTPSAAQVAAAPPPGSAATPPSAAQATAQGVPLPRPKPGAAAAPAPARWSGPIPSPPPRVGGRFLWPTRGPVILGYGPKGGGLHNDGINIAAPAGAPVVASENGVVAYAGNELRGYGNLILLRHADGWVTAYAHAEALLVRRGEIVRRGQTIARVGSSGSVDRPQLHFEIRKGSRAVDPIRELGRQTAVARPAGLRI